VEFFEVGSKPPPYKIWGLADGCNPLQQGAGRAAALNAFFKSNQIKSFI